jgi:O-antigen/teichoic acid export membrane protein
LFRDFLAQFKINNLQTARQVIFSRFGQGVMWNVVSLGILAVCGVLMNFVIAWFYTPDTLGVFNQVYSIYMLFSQVAVLGIHNSVLKYTAENQQQPETTRDILSSGVLAAAGIALVVCLLVYWLRGVFGALMSSPGVAIGLAWAAPGLVFFAINKVMLSALNGLQRMRAYAIFQSLRYIVLVVSLFIAGVLHQPGDILALAFTSAELVLFLSLGLYLLREFRISSVVNLALWAQRHLSFGVRGFLSNVFLQFNSRVDILVLGFFFNDYVVGIYSFAAILAEGIAQLLIGLQVNLNPILVQLLSGKELEKLRQVTRRAIRGTYLAMGAICVVAILVFPLGSLLVAHPEEYMQSWPIFMLLMLGLELGAGYVPLGAMMLQAGLPERHTLLMFLLSLSKLTANLLLIPWMAAPGAALAGGLSYLMQVLLIKYFCKKYISISL